MQERAKRHVSQDEKRDAAPSGHVEQNVDSAFAPLGNRAHVCVAASQKRRTRKQHEPGVLMERQNEIAANERLERARRPASGAVNTSPCGKWARNSDKPEQRGICKKECAKAEHAPPFPSQVGFCSFQWRDEAMFTIKYMALITSPTPMLQSAHVLAFAAYFRAVMMSPRMLCPLTCAAKMIDTMPPTRQQHTVAKIAFGRWLGTCS